MDLTLDLFNARDLSEDPRENNFRLKMYAFMMIIMKEQDTPETCIFQDHHEYLCHKLYEGSGLNLCSWFAFLARTFKLEPGSYEEPLFTGGERSEHKPRS